MGDAVKDQPIKTVSASEPATATILYPHGIAIHNGIDRVLVTSTVKPDMSEAGESVTVLEASTGKVLSTHKISIETFSCQIRSRRSHVLPQSKSSRGAHHQYVGRDAVGGMWDPKTQGISLQSDR